MRAADDPAFLQDTANQGGTILFYDERHTLLATTVVRPDAALVFTPQGWFSATDWPAGGLRLYGDSGTALADRASQQRRSPERILETLANTAH